MALIKCPECGKEISDKAFKCPQCGKQLNEKENFKKYCSECENELNDEDIVCPKCGCPVDVNENSSNNNNKIEDEPYQEIEGCIPEIDKKNSFKFKLTDKRKIVSCAIVLILLIGVVIYFSSDYWKYSVAKGYYEEKKYNEAAERFKKLDDYKDSKELYYKAEHQVAVMNDKDAPIISMNSKKVDLKQGEEFNVSEWLIDNNVTANDDISNGITCKVDMSELDVNKAGEYKLIVYAEDEAGNKQSEEVTVKVKKIYTQEELEKAVKSTYEKDIPGLERIEYDEPTVWVYLVHDGMAQSGITAKLNASVKNSWDEVMGELDKMSITIYDHLLSEGYNDIQTVNVMLLNDLDKSKMLYVTVNGIKFMDVTD